MTDQILPAEPPRRSAAAGFEPPVVLVGDFRGAPDSSATSLRGYLLIRALASSVVSAVQCAGLAILVLAALCWLGGVKWLAVLVALVAILVLLFRAMLSALARRLSGSGRLGVVEPAVARMVSRTRRGLRRELRRVGLPSTPWAALSIAGRLIRLPRRSATLQALSQVDLARVVPADQLDELHLILQGDRSTQGDWSTPR